MSRSRKIALFSLGFLFLLAVFTFYFSRASSGKGVLTISFLNVGQGDAIYIEAPNGAQIVVDGGPGRKLLSELGAVMPYFDRSIDAIIITNPDADHYMGFLDLLSRYKVGEVFEPGTRSDTPTYVAFEKEVEEKRVPKIIARRGMKIVLDKERGVYLSILFPDRDVSNWVINDGSIVAKLVYGRTSVMLEGDAPQKIEKYLISLHDDVRAQILKLGHHGSRTSTADEYVQAVHPEFAIISLGVNNRYGHPHEETLDTLRGEALSVLRTDEEGRITFISDGKSLKRID